MREIASIYAQQMSRKRKNETRPRLAKAPLAQKEEQDEASAQQKQQKSEQKASRWVVFWGRFDIGELFEGAWLDAALRG